MSKFKDKPTFPIKYKGKTYNTTIHKSISDDEFQLAKAEYYTKPHFSNVETQLQKVEAGGKKINFITDYYFKDIMAKVRVGASNWTIEDAWNYKPLIEFFAGKCERSPQFYPPTSSLCENVSAAFRMCGFKTCTKAPQFPIKTVDEILDLYNINNNYYDFACGWGSRLLGSIRNHINYFGTDPNNLLVDRLNELTTDYKKANPSNNTNVTIKCQGSEEFIPEWENTMGVAFSSPPYFDLEDYRIGKQSYIEGETTYTDWLNNYVRPTIDNINKYLVDDGYLCVNLKDTIQFPIRQDWHDIIVSKGFKFIDIHILKNIHRCHGHAEWSSDEDRLEKCGWNNNDEKIFIYQKVKGED